MNTGTFDSRAVENPYLLWSPFSTFFALDGFINGELVYSYALNTIEHLKSCVLHTLAETLHVTIQRQKMVALTEINWAFAFFIIFFPIPSISA